jgi:hypothetical protein
MTENFHIDMSNRLFDEGPTGIACVGANTKQHNGCALNGRLKKYINNTLSIGTIREDRAKIYAICIYYLIKDKISDIQTLIICNDEEFTYVKEYLLILLEQKPIEIIPIEEFKKRLGRNVKSLADNWARSYRKRALKRHRWDCGRKLNVVEITYESIKKKWEYIKESLGNR